METARLGMVMLAAGGFPMLFAGILVAVYIPLAAPFSGMSMNPARTLYEAAGIQPLVANSPL